MSKNKNENRRIIPSEEAKKLNVKLFLILVVNTAIIFGIYRLALNGPYFLYVMWSYMVLATALSLTYVLYNRAFSRRGITVDMLPDTMTYEEKQAYIKDGEQRMKKSKWMLTVIIPFIVTFIFEVIELYWGERIAKLFGF